MAFIKIWKKVFWRNAILLQDVNIFIVFLYFDKGLWAEILNKELKHCKTPLMDNLLSGLIAYYSAKITCIVVDSLI